MPRRILTDDVIERKCPEYQPLGFPNAYFDDVGGALETRGIKPVPKRPPPRPARLQYLSNNSNVSLGVIRAGVDENRELAQPVLNSLRAVQQALPIASAPPFDPNMLAGEPPQYFQEGDYYKSEELEEKSFVEDTGFKLYGEPVMLVPADDDVEEKDPMEHIIETRRSAVGPAVEALKRVQKAKQLARHTVDHTTPIDEGVRVSRSQPASRSSSLPPRPLERTAQKQARVRRERREARIKTFGAEQEGRAYYKRFGVEDPEIPRKGDPLVGAKKEKKMEKAERVRMGMEDPKAGRKSLRGSFAGDL